MIVIFLEVPGTTQIFYYVTFTYLSFHKQSLLAIACKNFPFKKKADFQSKWHNFLEEKRLASYLFLKQCKTASKKHLDHTGLEKFHQNSEQQFFSPDLSLDY